jgi:transglutaminase-like putative cysteine protease
MRLRIETELNYAFAEPTQVIGLVHAASSSDQLIVTESFEIASGASAAIDVGNHGQRRFRSCFCGSELVRYQADIDNGERELLPSAGRQHLWSELPADVLHYLLPSRFCPSDRFQRFAQREFGGAGDGVARVMAILDWISRHVDYVHGVSTAETTAAETFTVRAGVCRDFTHLGITLCRALSIPSRAVGAYALDLNPPDFHAVMEVFLDERWWLVDVTRLAPVEGLVRIAHGRDAADIAFLTTDRPSEMLGQNVSVSRL